MRIRPPEQAMWALDESFERRFSSFYCSVNGLGDKIASTIIAQSADVPILPWSGSRNYKSHFLS